MERFNVKRESLVGKIFDRLEVLELYGTDKRGKRLWKCKCSCGNPEFSIVRTETLNSGNARSCGCIRNEKSKERMTKHGLRFHKDYKVWLNMRNRCSNPNNPDYDLYGGRGITVCKDWDSFVKFLEDMGERPSSEYSIERIDGNGDYCKENCKWALQVEQTRNISIKSNNTSGFTGVHLVSTLVKGVIYQSWVATWSSLDGKSNRKWFSILKYGYEKAKELAIEYRKSKIEELNAQGAGYSDRHGT